MQINISGHSFSQYLNFLSLFVCGFNKLKIFMSKVTIWNCWRYGVNLLLKAQ